MLNKEVFTPHPCLFPFLCMAKLDTLFPPKPHICTDYHVLTYPYFFHSEQHGFANNRVEFLFRIYKSPVYSASICPHLFQLQKYYPLFF